MTVSDDGTDFDFNSKSYLDSEEGRYEAKEGLTINQPRPKSPLCLHNIYETA